MKKRLTCMLLCLVMMLSVLLAGCANDSDDDVQDEITDAASKNTVSLTMWVVSEEKVDSGVASAVTKALNSLTEAKYKTRLEIRYLTEDEYYRTLTETISEYEKAQTLTGSSGNGTTSGTEAETNNGGELETDADGMLRDKYPSLKPNQVDILYIGDLKDANGELLMSGEAMFNQLVSDGLLAQLDSALAGDAKKIQEYLSPTLLSAVKRNGVTYAIPNNNVIGEYTYLLLNESLMKKYSMQGHYLHGSIDGFYNEYVYQYLNMISEYTSGTGDDSVLPIDATYEECLELLAYYWSIDPDDYSLNGTDFSVFGSLYEDMDSLSRGDVILGVESLFENPEFVKAYLQLNRYRLNDSGRDFFRTDANAETEYAKSAVKFIKGDLTILTVEDGVSYYVDENGERYYAVVAKNPTATSEDIYGNMFAVYANSVNVSRSMEIIAYLNTNAEARNLLQYGVEGVHYDLDSNGYAVSKANVDGKMYKMDLYATGNVFLAYLTPGMNADIWESGKTQNRSSLVDPLLGFDLSSFASGSGQIGTDISIPTLDGEKSYDSLTYSSGYSKEVLSQNKILKDWLTSCDVAGKGIYIYKSVAEDKNTIRATYYLYNSIGEADFAVIPTAVMTKQEDANGNQTEKETGLNLEMAYTNVKESGYVISVVSFSGKFSANYATTLSATANGESATMKESGQTGVLNFDFMNTQYYKVQSYGDLHIANFYENNTLYKQLLKWVNDAEREQLNLLTWVDTTSSQTENTYTYLIMRRNLSCATDLEIQMTGDAKSPILNFVFTEDKEIKFDEMITGTTGTYKNDPYLLYYVTVTTDKDVTLSYQTSMNGVADRLSPIVTEGTDAMRFDVFGELNTELIAYMKSLNDELVALLNACTTYEELEAVVADFAILLSTEKLPSNGDLNSELVKAYVADADGMVHGDLQTLYYQIRHITNYQKMDEVLKAENSGWTSEKINGETKVYYYSPFGIYYQWLQEYSYMPAQ